jgi:decaprenylphospho-beta-D-ribofuranose 2-oxidase
MTVDRPSGYAERAVASATSGVPPGIASSEKDLDCYSGLYSARATVLEPENLDELREVFAFARESGRRVTLRAGGHSFDAQALGKDLVVSMMRFDSIEVLANEKRIRVGAGTMWGEILATLEPLGLVPAVTVTTANATAGGTLSGDCLSRFSPAYGKEGSWIESFDLLTPQGELLVCTPPREGATASGLTREERAFRGVIGGLGYLGAVVAITYRVLSVGQAEGKIGVRTVIGKYETFAGLASDLVPIARQTYDEDSDPEDPNKLDAISSALDTRTDGRQAALLFKSAFTAEPRRRLMALYRPRVAIRLIVEWLMRIPGLAGPLWRFYFRFVYRDGEEYVDDLEGFTFFMDGNVRAKGVAKRFGINLRMAQQTFVVPSGVDGAGGWDRARDKLVEWLDYAHEFLLERGLTPMIHDVLFLPKDAPFPFLLSASADLPGFAVSYAFEASNDQEAERVKQAFSDMANVLWERFGGRVYLVKNVCAERKTLAKMYGDNAIEFVRLKRELDPGGVMRNDFLDRTLGDVLDADSA